MELYEMLAVARDVSGKSLRAVEEESGISNALISQYETGVCKKPSFENIVKLSRVYGVNLDKFAKTID